MKWVRVGRIVLFFMAVFISSLQLMAEGYDVMWSNAKKYADEGFPASALSEVAKIAARSDAEGHKGHRMAASLYACMLRQTITPDSFYTDMVNLEDLRDAETNVVSRAVYASVLGELYEKSVHRNRNYSDDAWSKSTDIREWSDQRFRQESLRNYRMSMEDISALMDVSSKEYMPFVEQGGFSDVFHHDMLHLLMARATKSHLVRQEDNWKEWFREASELYGKQGNRDAQLLLRLDSLDIIRNTDGSKTLEQQSAPYELLLSEFAGSPYLANVYLRLAQIHASDVAKRMTWIERGLEADIPEQGKAVLEALKAEMEAPFMNVSLPNAMYPCEELEVALTSRALKDGRWQWMRLPEELSEAELQRMDRDSLLAYATCHGVPVKEQTFELPQRFLYERGTDTVKCEAPDEYGRYALCLMTVAANGKDTLEAAIWCGVSRFRMMLMDVAGRGTQCRVVDAMTGSPVEGVQVKRMEQEKVADVFVTDVKGACFVSKHASQFRNTYKLELGQDRFLPVHTTHLPIHDKKADRTLSVAMRLYTDRTIYRPGDSVYIAGLSYYDEEHIAAVCAQDTAVVLLLDERREEIVRDTLFSDEMGKFSTRFYLPKDARSGMYVLRVLRLTEGDGRRGHMRSHQIRVEAYKRPTFSVELDTEGARLEDTCLKVKGMAIGFNGIPLRGARVVVRSEQVNRWMRDMSSDNEVFVDTLATDAEGVFTCSLPLNDAKPRQIGIRQRINVQVTSLSGESQETTRYIPISSGGVQIRISPSLTASWNRDRLPVVSVGLYTMYGTEVEQYDKCVYDLYATDEVGSYNDTIVVDKPLMPADSISWEECRELASGRYLLRLRAEADGVADTLHHSFQLYGWEERKVPEGEACWFHVVEDEASEEQPAKILFGSGLDDVTLFCTFFGTNGVLADTIVQLSDSLLHWEFKMKDEDVMTVHYAFVKDNEAYERQWVLRKKIPERTLDLHWTTFRDRLQPGAMETWTLSVRYPDGTPAKAQVMAAMYDASLDALAGSGGRYRWNTLDLHRQPVPTFLFQARYPPRNFFVSEHVETPVVMHASEDYDHFDERCLAWDVYGNGLRVPKAVTSDVSEFVGLAMNTVGGTLLQGRIAGLDIVENSSEALGSDEMTERAVQAVSPWRTRFNETAFFFPQLMADKKGNVKIAFAMPEGLTTWNVQVFAHTKDLYTGVLQNEVVASKDVMVQCHLPRFVRKGDRTALKATLFNNTGKLLRGTVEVEIFDPEKNVILWKGREKIRLEAKSDSVVPFYYEASGEEKLLACRVLFKSRRHTDGEQHYLPVLSDTERLTQTIPFYLSEETEKTIDLSPLFQGGHPDATDREWEISYTAQPLWNVVRALPAMVTSEEQDVRTLATAFYAKSVAERLVTRFPVLKETLDSCMSGGLHHDVAGKLGELQLPDGSFAWFKGMQGSHTLTLRVAMLLARSGCLNEASLPIAEKLRIQDMIAYLSNAFEREADAWRAFDKRGMAIDPNNRNMLEYLYIVSQCAPELRRAVNEESVRYAMSELLAGRHRMDRDHRLMAVPLFELYGFRIEAQSIRASLKEYVVSDETGMHWNYPSNGFVSAERKMEQHVWLMDALLNDSTSSADVRNGLCQWLLMQKQTLAWRTPQISAEAVYALLRYQEGNLGNEDGSDRLCLLDSDGTIVEDWSVDSGTASPKDAFVVQMKGGELQNKTTSLAVRRTKASGTSWGCVSVQYNLPIQAVLATGSGMSVYVEIPERTWYSGDKTTLRYVVTADRDYDYVRLKGVRAACMEPADAVSGMYNSNGLSYYKEVKDSETYYYFERLPKGTFVIEEDVYIEREGYFTTGVPTLSGLYAPEFGGYGTALNVEVKER